jgi:hypothetical protein
MPLTYHVPKEDQKADASFSFPLTHGGKTDIITATRPLEENSLETLRLLAKKIGLRSVSKLRRFDLACALAPYIFFTTREEAVAAWPILAARLEDTEDDLRDQSMALRASAGFLDPNYTAHFRTREAQVQAAMMTIQMESARAARRAPPPAWWGAGKFVEEDEWDEDSAPAPPYLRVVVEATTRTHDGYCSDVEEDEDGEFVYSYTNEPVKLKERSFLMVGNLPLKDDHGANWKFQGPSFEPWWNCCGPKGGSGVCGVPATIRFVSMTRVE